MADVSALWTYKIQGEAVSTAITHRGDFIFVGGKEGACYCFERSGRLLWRGNVDSVPVSLVVAEAGECVLVGCTSGKAYLWNYQGHLLQILEVSGAIWGLDITPTAHRTVVGTSAGELCLFDFNGALLWQRTLSAPVRRLSITPDGNRIVLGCDDYAVYIFDSQGAVRWRHATRSFVWAGAVQTPDSSTIVAGSNDQQVYVFGRAGHLLWNYNTGASVNVVALTPDGRFVAAAGNGRTVLFFDAVGNLLWKYDTKGDVYALALSDDGRFVLVGTRNNTILLLNAFGECVWTKRFHKHVDSVALTPNGRLAVAVSQDRTVMLIENRLAPADMSDAWFANTVIAHVRHAYSVNTHTGLVAWFDAFDLALLQRQFALCDALLRAISEGAYQFYNDEQKLVASRAAALLFYQGLWYYQHDEYQLAQQAYTQSRAIYHNMPYPFGEGQVLVALKILDGTFDSDERILLPLIVEPPTLLGSSQTFLAQRMQRLEEDEQYQIVLTSLRQGYLEPLLIALSSPSVHIQSAAITALTWLEPGPNGETLLTTLFSPYWLVRWQTVLLLTARAAEGSQRLGMPKERVTLALRQQLKNEEDPTVLQALVKLIRVLEDSASTPMLLRLLTDSDSDVRLAAVETLGVVGTTQALQALTLVVGGQDMAMKEQAALALQRIRQRKERM